MELKQFMQILRKRMLLILIVVVLSGVAAGFYSIRYMVPVYEASNKLIVNKSVMDSSGNPLLDVNVINTNIMLINSYKEIIRSQRIMSKVLEQNPDIQLSTGDIMERLKVVTTQNSQIVTLKVSDSSYMRAATLVNAIAKVFQEEVPQIMQVNNITILDSAKMVDEASPISPSVKMNIALALVVSFMLSIGIVFLLEYLDDSVKSEFDVEHYLELNTLGIITKISKRDLKSKARSTPKNQAGEKYATANS